MEDRKNKKNQQQQQPQWTHFISLPFNKPNVIEQYEKIKKEILTDKPELEPFFLGSSKAHITLNMMHLNEQQVEKIQKVWPILEKKIPKLNVTLQGWGCFGKQKKQSKYLYFNVSKGLDEIQQLGNTITSFLVEHGILDPNKEALHNIKIIEDDNNKNNKFYKLQTVHATYMKSRTKDTFDSNLIIDKFPNFEISNIEVDSIHCSIIQPQHPDLFYKSLCTINLV